VYLFNVVQIRHIIKDDQNYACNVSANKIYQELVQAQYFNGYTRIKENHILNTCELIDSHEDEINMI